ncbi:MAG: chorismate synthase [Microthrixaceae bacterium]|nr:chorismate synthase [Microthrixaceae bacterium]
MASSTGVLFRVTTFGESHGGAVGCVVDGCPPLLALGEGDIQPDLDRRRPGQSRLVTQRDETDTVEILSGVDDGHTIGSPIAMIVRNSDQRPGAYDHMADLYRPSHADWSTEAKYGTRAVAGGGRASARETIGALPPAQWPVGCSPNAPGSRSSHGCRACTASKRASRPTA